VNENERRVEQFRSEIADMKLKGESGEGEKRWLVLGIVVAVAGIALAIFWAIQVGEYGGDPANQRAYMAQGSFMGIALVIVGAALFVRYSLARYMRFWLVRLTYESRANTDRLVEAIERAAGLDIDPGADTVAPPQQVVYPAGTHSGSTTTGPGQSGPA
jgi:hypothetical protein